MSAEVKQYVISQCDTADLAHFANEIGRRAALGVVVALGFDSGVRESLKEIGLNSLDLRDMRRTVSLWHPLKQRAAISGLVYYARHVEKNTRLANRIE